jgi:hypothetical protein
MGYKPTIRQNRIQNNNNKKAFNLAMCGNIHL